MIRPSAPAATAARAIGATISRRPAPWLGSAMIGRWLSFLTTGIAGMSNVLRVAVSNVVLPAPQHPPGRGQPLLDRRRDAALEEHGLARVPQLAQQREVLHVASADL